MLTKRKEPEVLFQQIVEILDQLKKDIKIQIKKKPKSSHSILSILIFLLPFLLVNEIEQNEFFFIDKRANTSKITFVFIFLYSITLNLFFYCYIIIYYYINYRY